MSTSGRLGTLVSFFWLLTFFKNNFYKKLFQEHYQSVKQFGSRSNTHILSDLIWVQTVCKGNQQTTKVKTICMVIIVHVFCHSQIYFIKNIFQELLQSIKQFGSRSGPDVIKAFSCSTQPSIHFIILKNVKMSTIVGILTIINMINITSESLTRNIIIFQHFSDCELLKFHAQLSWAYKKFYNFGARPDMSRCFCFSDGSLNGWMPMAIQYRSYHFKTGKKGEKWLPVTTFVVSSRLLMFLAYIANNMDPDQTDYLGAVWSGFIVLASMKKI